MKQFQTIFLFALLGLTHAGAIQKCEISLFDCFKKPVQILPLNPDDCKCRLKASSRIVNGKFAEVNQIPWMVSLADSDGHLCGRSIINQNYVLTAAHCVDHQKAHKIKVRVGLHELIDSDIKTKTYKVEKIIEKGSKSNESINDIAILKLAKPIRFISGKVEPACINFEKMNYTNPMMASGWGSFERAYEQKNDSSIIKVGPMSEVLKIAYFNETDLSDIGIDQVCDSEYMICIDSDNRYGTCFGDSGGAIHYDHNGKTGVEGVAASVYYDTETEDEYIYCTGKGDYSRLSYYKDWVQEIIGDNYCHL